ncbi:ABC transporter substrate-binding protein [Occultella glacieicola]|uniref:ABC transporter substrate-binding protein n=1 Tax=Occultella glacieicola TaxID=2518684 RepID=A0ABY2E0H9_9MICO|nr:ABC transporter substrate-binding protein [Occultella glacieicola]TDE88561.1 ABC transporter substrate-binding protein [Occultella glacieicola]
MRRSIPRLSGIVAVTLALGACSFDDGSGGGTGGDEPGGSGGDAGGHITLAEWLTIDASFALGTDDAFILTRAGCLEPLARYTESGELEPSLATEWSQVDDLTWSFTIREGVQFQDGTDLTPEAVANALTHTLESDTAARSFNPSTVTAIEAGEDGTVLVTTPVPDPLLPLRLSTPSAGILAEAAFTGAQIDVVGTCTGPFEIVDVNYDTGLEIIRNENYWGGEVALTGGTISILPDGATRTTQLETGEVDIASSVPVTDIALLEPNPDVTVSTNETARTTGLYFNTETGPFADEAARLAVQAALDLEAIAGSVYESAATPAVGPFAPSAPWAPEGAGALGGDPAAATAILEDAGIDPASLDFELIAYTSRPEFANLAAVIQSQLAEIGITVSITTPDYAAIEANLLAGDYGATLLSRNALTDLPDPGGMLSSDYTCEGGFNISQFCDPEVDTMIADAASTFDDEERYAAYADIATYLQEHAVTVYIVHETATYAHTNAVEGFVPNLLDQYVFTTALSISE